MSKKRLYDLDKAKGLAILLVVIGHVVTGKPPERNDWVISLTYWIYLFHMPFFMFLSGAIFYYTYKPIETSEQYFTYIWKKAKRLLPGFFLFGLLVLIGKYLASFFLHVDNLRTNLFGAIIEICITPTHSVSSSLWYIYVLFEFYLLFPLFLFIFRYNLFALLIGSLILHIVPYFIPFTAYFGIASIAEYTFFFSLGCLFVTNLDEIDPLVEKYSGVAILLFFASFLLTPYIDHYLAKTLIGLASVPALYSFVKLKFLKHSDDLYLLLGEFTFSIYLMNTIFIGLTKGLLLKIMPWDGTNFLLFFPTMVLAGGFGPIFFQKYLLSRSSYLNSITK
jgi:fucose 4-O-acetylase-like acetyltransferase